MAIQISGTTVIDNSTNVNVGAAGSFHVTGGEAFVKNNAVGLGQTDTTGRDAGIGTAKGTLIYNTSESRVEVYDGTNWIGGLTTPFTATGGTEYTYNNHKIHTFTSPGTFSVTSGSSSDIEYLVIAGGGAGSGQRGGGGGAGGYRTGTGFSVSLGSYPITVGAGGAEDGTSIGGNGTPSIFSTITSTGGGGGGPLFTPNDGASGGSGGGAGAEDSNTGSGGAGNTPPTSPPQGNPGGNSAGSGGFSGAGGGGGGAGGAGQNASAPKTPGWGGVGLQAPTTFRDPSNPYGAPGPSPGGFWFSGGGGGGSFNGPSNGTGGGPGGPYSGGGNGKAAATGDNGGTNTGGGAGSGGRNGGSFSGGNGGSGIVMIAYPTS